MKTNERNASSVTVCATAMDLIHNFLKRIVRRPQNPTFNVGRESKYKRMKLFPALTYKKSMGRDIRIANRKAKISLVTPVLPQVIR
jgi:hypothetical protein